MVVIVDIVKNKINTIRRKDYFNKMLLDSREESEQMHLKLLTKERQATVPSRISGSAQPTIYASMAELFWPSLLTSY